MATAVIHEDEDLMACGVCFNQYDLKDNKPKFLQCSHTICLPCAKGIFKEGTIRCPFCRLLFSIKSADSLPNNNYATQILGLMGRNNEQTISGFSPNHNISVEWCLVCQSAANSSCKAFGHYYTIRTNSEAMKDMEQTVQLKSQLLQMKDQGINTLAQVIQKRKQIREHLDLVMKSIHSAEDEVKKLQDDNDFMLAKVVSILESNKQLVTAKASKVSLEEKEHMFTSEFMSIVEDVHPDDTMEILKLKLEDTLEVFDGYLNEATSAASSYDNLRNMKIMVVLNNQPGPPILNLNLSKRNQSKQEVMLLSHSILSILGGSNSAPKAAVGITSSNQGSTAAESGGVNVRAKNHNKRNPNRRVQQQSWRERRNDAGSKNDKTAEVDKTNSTLNKEVPETLPENQSTSFNDFTTGMIAVLDGIAANKETISSVANLVRRPRRRDYDYSSVSSPATDECCIF